MRKHEYLNKMVILRQRVGKHTERGGVTVDGTAVESRLFTSLKILKNLSITDPETMLQKKTFQMKKYRTFMHALLFLPLREIEPSILENSIINGGTM